MIGLQHHIWKTVYVYKWGTSNSSRSELKSFIQSWTRQSTHLAVVTRTNMLTKLRPQVEKYCRLCMCAFEIESQYNYNTCKCWCISQLLTSGLEVANKQYPVRMKSHRQDLCILIFLISPLFPGSSIAFVAFCMYISRLFSSFCGVPCSTLYDKRNLEMRRQLTCNDNFNSAMANLQPGKQTHAHCLDLF